MPQSIGASSKLKFLENLSQEQAVNLITNSFFGQHSELKTTNLGNPMHDMILKDKMTYCGAAINFTLNYLKNELEKEKKVQTKS